jgi:acyl transferase domain-containing protein
MDTTQGIADLPIAVIGMACRLPGAGNLEQFWELLVGGRSSVGEVPANRFDQELYYDPRQGIPAKSYTKIGALLDSREFDRAHCPLPEELVRSADPTHLLMCEVAAAACRHAGLDPFNLPGDVRNAGVYVGHAQGSTLAGDYIYHTCVEEAAQLLPDLKELGELPADDRAALADELVSRVREGLPSRSPDSPDVSTHMVAGLVSKAFGLSGPYLALNAACASSPQALLLAVRALQLGRIEMAIVGGASDCKSDTLTLFSAAQSMSASGSRPFDAEADGLVCGEGYVALVLKTLQRALADGDPVQAVIRSLGISSDGHGKSLWAPRKEGQIEAMKRAYRGGLDPSSLQYIEAHATSTSLGDATELTALGEVLASRVSTGQKVALGSVKANIGHTLECAGLASVCKTILCMQKGTIPAAINIRELNKKIDWQKAPFYVPTQPTAWPEPAVAQPRRAAVNSFGIGGLNMHIVLEAFSKAVHRREERPQPVPSFRTADGEAIAVIGMGCILPGAEGIDKFWQLLESGREAIVDAPPDRWPQTSVTRRLPTKRGGFITDFQYDWRRHKVPPKQVAQADPMQFMLLEAADQALKHAGYDKRPFNKKMVGVLVGTEFGGDFSTQLTLGLRLPHMQKLLGELLSRRGMEEAAVEQAKEAFCKALLARWPALVDETGSFSTSTLASRITKTLDLMGGAAAIDSGDTSAMAALAGSIDLLLAGDCDFMFCAAGQRRMAPATYEALAMAGVLRQQDDRTSPLDARANGFVPGEGVGVMLLKRLADARRDGDPIHAIIRGIGVARVESCQQALELAMQRSLAFAGSSPEELALLEVDGHGLNNEDRQIVAAARQLSGENRSIPLVLGTAVGQLGHTGGASGMISLLKANLELEKGTAPAIVGLHDPLPEAADASLLAPRQPIALRPLASDGRRLAGVASQGKGLAFHVVVQRTERVPAEQVTTSLQPATGSRAAIVPPPTVTTAPMSLSSSKAIQIAPDHGARPLRRQRPRVAFLFPGQGSQYAGMLRELVAASPAARAAMDELDAAMRRAGEPTFAELAWGDARGLGRDIWQTQIAMLLADMIVHAALQERGIAPDVVAGHSFGEIAALTAAGAWDLDTAIQIVKARAAGVASSGSRGGLMATSAPRERIEELAALQGQSVYVANHNAADQTVVGGMRESLESFAAVLKQHGFSSQMLAVPAAFHTPLMLGASGPLETALHAAGVWPPQAPLLSSITVRYEADPQTIRENLARQLTRPVEWVALIRRLANEGPVVLVEVGPQQVLTKLSRRILQDRQIAGIVATDDPKQPGPQQLDRVQEMLESVGAMDRGRSRIARLAAPSGPQERGKIVHFDATEVRRERMRQAAKQETSARGRAAAGNAGGRRANARRTGRRREPDCGGATCPDGQGQRPCERGSRCREVQRRSTRGRSGAA